MWTQTFTGLAVDLLDPKPEQINVVDIAWSLAHINRFSGHTRRPWPVTDHSVLVAHGVERELSDRAQAQGRGLLPRDWLVVVHALLHDAHEAYTGDMPAPLKRGVLAACIDDIEIVENNLDIAVADALAVPHRSLTTGRVIRRHDLRALMTERRDLLTAPPRPWGDELEEIEPYKIKCWRALAPCASAHNWLYNLRRAMANAELDTTAIEAANEYLRAIRPA